MNLMDIKWKAETVKDGIAQSNPKGRLIWGREERQSPLPNQSCKIVLETRTQLVANPGSTLYWKSIFAAQLLASYP